MSVVSSLSVSLSARPACCDLDATFDYLASTVQAGLACMPPIPACAGGRREGTLVSRRRRTVDCRKTKNQRKESMLKIMGAALAASISFAASALAADAPAEIKIGTLYASSGRFASISMPVHSALKL